MSAARLPLDDAIEQARAVLWNASLPSSAAVEEATLGVGVEILAGRLFESISMQLSVPLYFAEYTVRGANLDTLRLPLTNAPYLLDRLDAAAAVAPTDPTRRAIVSSLTNWADPGPGGFYDDLGDPGNSPHMVTPLSWDADPDYYANPSEDRALVKDQHWSKLAGAPPLALPLMPVSWQTTVNTFYQAPLKLRYEGLEKNGNYSVEVVYTVPTIYLNLSAPDRLGEESSSTPKPLVRTEQPSFTLGSNSYSVGGWISPHLSNPGFVDGVWLLVLPSGGPCCQWRGGAPADAATGCSTALGISDSTRCIAGTHTARIAKCL